MSSPKFDRELFVIIGLSFCSMLVISTENTLQNMQKSIVSSIEDDKPGFTVDGYTLTGVRYTLSCIALWFSPYVSYALGPRVTMSLSAIGFLFHLMSFITEDELAIYVGALTLGVAEACFWPAEGRYMIENSSPQNLASNVGVFLFIIKFSYVLGNLFVFFSFYGQQYLDRESRNEALYSLSALNTVAIFAYGFLPKSTTKAKGTYGVIKTMKKSWEILLSPKMLLLLLSFSYYGLQMAFWNGVYSSSLGFTLAFGDSVKELVGLSGIFMSFGGVFGCLLPIIFAGWVQRYHRARFLLVLSGSVAQLLGYLISVLIMPEDAVFNNTNKEGLISPSVGLAMLGSVLLSYGDACLFVQTYSILGDFYRESCAEAIALHKFVRNAFAAVSYFWSAYFDLYTQVIICAVMAVVHTICFFLADQDPVDHELCTKLAESTTNSTCGTLRADDLYSSSEKGLNGKSLKTVDVSTNTKPYSASKEILEGKISKEDKKTKERNTDFSNILLSDCDKIQPTNESPMLDQEFKKHLMSETVEDLNTNSNFSSKNCSVALQTEDYKKLKTTTDLSKEVGFVNDQLEVSEKFLASVCIPNENVPNSSKEKLNTESSSMTDNSSLSTTENVSYEKESEFHENSGIKDQERPESEILKGHEKTSGDVYIKNGADSNCIKNPETFEEKFSINSTLKASPKSSKRLLMETSEKVTDSYFPTVKCDESNNSSINQISDNPDLTNQSVCENNLNNKNMASSTLDPDTKKDEDTFNEMDMGTSACDSSLDCLESVSSSNNNVLSIVNKNSIDQSCSSDGENHNTPLSTSESVLDTHNPADTNKESFNDPETMNSPDTCTPHFASEENSEVTISAGLSTDEPLRNLSKSNMSFADVVSTSNKFYEKPAGTKSSEGMISPSKNIVKHSCCSPDKRVSDGATLPVKLTDSANSQFSSKKGSEDAILSNKSLTKPMSYSAAIKGTPKNKRRSEGAILPDKSINKPTTSYSTTKRNSDSAIQSANTSSNKPSLDADGKKGSEGGSLVTSGEVTTSDVLRGQGPDGENPSPYLKTKKNSNSKKSKLPRRSK